MTACLAYSFVQARNKSRLHVLQHLANFTGILLLFFDSGEVLACKLEPKGCEVTEASIFGMLSHRLGCHRLYVHAEPSQKLI